KEYAALFEKRTRGEFNGRNSRILSTSIYQDVAYAEIEVLISSINARFIDLILLKKFGEDWKIVSKTATRFPAEKPYTGPQQKVIMSGLKKPWSMDFINNKEVIVAEKDGDLLWVNLESKEKKVIKGFPDDLFTPLQLDVKKYPKGTYPTSVDGRLVRMNAGIFEVLLDPDFEKNKYIYVSYVSEKGDTYALKVIRAKLINNTLTEVKTLLNPGPYVPGLYHFGGGMTFGADGKLYITAGERLFYEYLKEGLAIAQDLTDERGKIYRINPDGSIPEDNPDFGTDAVKGMYAVGIRAAQGITLHPFTGQIWFSEHGTIQGDEINLLQAGANYGWPNVTSGKYRSPGYQPAEVPNANFTAPIHYWLQTVAPTGLVFYNGYEFSEWQGDLIVPGLSRGSLWRVSLEGEKVKIVEELFMDHHVRLRKAEMSPDGKLYILTSEENGKIIEITK
ncbi:MAG: PQQ-dependent sugar dehydrogenase, partial [Bacteroidota bacterium]